MENISMAVIAGNLAADATKVNEQVVNFSVASSKREKVGEEWKDVANFFDFVIYGKRGQALLPYLKKGIHVLIQATPHQDRWSKDGKNFSRIVFRVENIELAGAKKEAEPAYQESPIF